MKDFCKLLYVKQCSGSEYTEHTCISEQNKNDLTPKYCLCEWDWEMLQWSTVNTIDHLLCHVSLMFCSLFYCSHLHYFYGTSTSGTKQSRNYFYGTYLLLEQNNPDSCMSETCRPSLPQQLSSSEISEQVRVCLHFSGDQYAITESVCAVKLLSWTTGEDLLSRSFVPGLSVVVAEVSLAAWLCPLRPLGWRPLLALRWCDLESSCQSQASAPAPPLCGQMEHCLMTGRIFTEERRPPLLTSCGRIFWTERCIPLPSAEAPRLYSCHKYWQPVWSDWQEKMKIVNAVKK